MDFGSAATRQFRGSRRRGEAQRLALLDPEVGDEPFSKSGAGRALHRERVAQRRQRGFIELLAAFVVRDTNTDVIEHLQPTPSVRHQPPDAPPPPYSPPPDVSDDALSPPDIDS